MNFEALRELDECMAICGKLTELLNEDMDEMHQYVTGELYDVYRAATIDAIDAVSELKNKLLTLYHQESAMM